MIVPLTVELGDFRALEVSIEAVPVLNASVQTAEISLNVSDNEIYRGEHEVVPQTFEQVLDTSHKYLLDNVTVRSIPFFEIGNESGGNTIYIGSEV